tara:strand:+ start:4203 stop:4556 length:354 start_codon:yes stop_codon:yes gene_type:complete
MTDNFSPPIELESATLNVVDFIDFRKFLVENKVVVTIVSFTIATYMNDLIKSFFDDFLFCFLSEECENDTVSSIFKYEFEIFKIKFKVGKLLLAIIKFILAAILAFFISRSFNDFIN